MKKMNKKGFTLIEMLAVIAVIAILVAIIIPTVTSATDRAKAATNAANLRSCKAELVTMMLANGDIDETRYPKDDNGNYTRADADDLFKTTKDHPTGTFEAVVSGFDVTVTFAGEDIAYWAGLAAGDIDDSVSVKDPSSDDEEIVETPDEEKKDEEGSVTCTNHSSTDGDLVCDTCDAVGKYEIKNCSCAKSKEDVGKPGTTCDCTHGHNKHGDKNNPGCTEMITTTNVVFE